MMRDRSFWMVVLSTITGLNDMNRITETIVILSLMGSVAGCGASSGENTGYSAVSTDDTANGSVSYDYEAPVQIPNILVDQVGYKTDSEKTVVFRGTSLPAEFKVIDIDLEEAVYSGQVMKVSFDEETGQYTALGYFSDLKTEGNYYIYTDILGESYEFSISDTVYDELFNEAAKTFYYNRCGIALSEDYAGENAHSACHTTIAHLQEDPKTEIDVTGGWHIDEQADRDTTLGCVVAENFLLSYEMNESAFTDETGIPESGNEIPDILDEVRYEVEWLLKMQDSKTGGEYGAAVTDSSKGGELLSYPVYVTPVSMEATINFASMMARFSYIYQQYDEEFALTCLRAADKAWNCFINNQNVTEDTSAFKAAAQLFRATGSQNYHDVLTAFFERSDFEELFNSDEDIFIGAVTYLSTNQEVDVEECGILMKLLMKKSEAIAQFSSSSAYLVSKGGEEENFEKLLYDMRCLTITDHIIYNHEYTTIIENHAHYIMGRNPRAMNYATSNTLRTYADESGKTGILNNPLNSSLLIFMMSVLEQ